MLRLWSAFQAVLIVIVAVVSCVHGLQVPLDTSELVQAVHEQAVSRSIGAGFEDGVTGLLGPSRDLNGYGWGTPECKKKCKECKKCESCKKCMKKKVPKVPKDPKKKIVVTKPKTKIVSKPKKKIVVTKPKTKIVPKKTKTFIIKHRFFFSKKKFFKKKFFFHH